MPDSKCLCKDRGKFVTLPAMETTRQNKINRLLVKDLTEIFEREFRATFKGYMVTFTKVKITPDLSIARVYVSIFTMGDKDEALKMLKEKKNEIRFHLGTRVKNQLRIVPSLEFFIDDSLDYIEKIDQLLKS